MLRHKSRQRASLAVLALLTAACTCRAAVINLHECANVAGARIVLAELGAITGAEEEVAALADIDIGPTPLPGRERTLTVGYLKMRLRRCGIDCGSVTFIGSAQVLVSAAPLASDPPAAPAPAASATGAELPATAPVIVPRGTRVQLAVECGAVRVLADAVTQEQAAVGALVRLRIEHTGEAISARLTAPTQAIMVRE
ncbi:MAG: hypothetical protein AB7Y46_17965 [Armatimonadota bacterium]